MKIVPHLSVGVIMAAISAAQANSPLRNVIYYDQYHNITVPGKDITESYTHVLMAFADSALFTSSAQAYEPFDSVSHVRQLFGPNTKIGISVGGWGQSAGFSDAVKTDESRRRFVDNVINMVNTHGFDLLDIDWEFPGGNGEDYLQENSSNDQKLEEPAKFPLLLEELRAKLSGKELSIAVPGKVDDMIAFSAANADNARAFAAVDFVNVMAYDLMNRRDKVTAHHTSVDGALISVKHYIDTFGLAPAKINLGFALYAKWFELPTGDCLDFDCPILDAELPNGTDANTSGAVTFEEFNYSGVPAKNTSAAGVCGPLNGLSCDSSCCSTSGYCGTEPAYCGFGCLPSHGTCDPDVADMLASFRNAMEKGTLSRTGVSYIDTRWVANGNKWFFWTWDSPETIGMKFDTIVKNLTLGGVFAWSLGEDSHEWSHIKAINAGVEALKR